MHEPEREMPADRPAKASPWLEQNLTEIRARHPGSQPEMVADVVRAILTSMSSDLAAKETSMLNEVQDLGRTISDAKAEIAALNVAALNMIDINASHIPRATDQLDAIVAHTASATDAILETCETLDRLAASLTGDPALQLQEATTRIYEACGFQDITGQRINKIVAALKMIEVRVASIVARFGAMPLPPGALSPGDDGVRVHGPQLPDRAMGQSDIDRLLASFD